MVEHTILPFLLSLQLLASAEQSETSGIQVFGLEAEVARS
jgi:hypothetical protein